MTAWARVVEVSCATSDTSKTVTGLPGTPKGLICLVGAGTAIQERPSFSVGFADGTTQCNAAWRMTPSATPEDHSIFNNSRMGSTWNTFVERTFTLTAFTSDGFTFSIDGGSLEGATVVRFLVFGGSGVSAHVRRSIQSSTGSPHSQTGLIFQPTALVGLFSQVGGSVSFNALQGFGQASIAVFDGTNKRAHIAAGENLVAAANTASAARTGDPLTLSASSFALASNIGITSLNSDGYTWSQSDGSNTVTMWLALAGISVKVLTTTVPAATGTVALTGAGFQPTGALVLASPTATAATFSDTARLSVGFQSQTTPTVSALVHTDTLDPSEPQVLSRSNAVVYGIDRTGTNTFADRCVASVQSYDSDGLTLNWTDADATAGLVSVLAFRASADASAGASKFRDYFITG